jgi:hypothetical protein
MAVSNPASSYDPLGGGGSVPLLEPPLLLLAPELGPVERPRTSAIWLKTSSTCR